MRVPKHALIDNYSGKDLQVSVHRFKGSDVIVVTIHDTEIGQVGGHTTVKDAIKSGERYVSIPFETYEKD
jgi:hypothetical protein